MSRASLRVRPIYLEVRCRKSPRNVFVCFVNICVMKAILMGVNEFFTSDIFFAQFE